MQYIVLWCDLFCSSLIFKSICFWPMILNLWPALNNKDTLPDVHATFNVLGMRFSWDKKLSGKIFSTHGWPSKNRGGPPKMDGENNGKPLLKWDDLGVPLFLETPTSIFPRKFMEKTSQKIMAEISSFESANIFTWVFPKIGVFTPQIIPLIGVFHYFHHPFWGVKSPLCLEGHPSSWWLNQPI